MVDTKNGADSKNGNRGFATWGKIDVACSLNCPECGFRAQDGVSISQGAFPTIKAVQLNKKSQKYIHIPKNFTFCSGGGPNSYVIMILYFYYHRIQSFRAQEKICRSQSASRVTKAVQLGQKVKHCQKLHFLLLWGTQQLAKKFLPGNRSSLVWQKSQQLFKKLTICSCGGLNICYMGHQPLYLH